MRVGSCEGGGGTPIACPPATCGCPCGATTCCGTAGPEVRIHEQNWKLIHYITFYDYGMNSSPNDNIITAPNFINSLKIKMLDDL